MADRTSIAWCDATVNFWWGCQEVSPGCDHCYARTMAAYRPVGKPPRIAKWGPREERVAIWTSGVLTAQLQNRAKREGRRLRVFTNSMADFFDNAVDPIDRDWAWDRILDATELDWLILTKRPQNIVGMLPEWWGDGPANVALGVSCENQVEADRRLPLLRAIPAAHRFVSYEPALGPLANLELAGIGWLIAGGESGPGFRPMELAWLESITDQCRAAGVALFVKQDSGAKPGQWGRIPEALRIREFPR